MTKRLTSRLLSGGLALVMLLSLLPVETLAAEGTPDGEPAGCICETACTEETANADCPVCRDDYTKCAKADDAVTPTPTPTVGPTTEPTPAPTPGPTVEPTANALTEPVGTNGALDSVFTKLELHRDGADGPLVVDLLDPNDEEYEGWYVAPQSIYYLCVELQPGENEYVQLHYGNADPNGACTGVSITNPIGGTLNEGSIESVAFDAIAARTDSADPTYGSNKKLQIDDGTVVYHIKTQDGVIPKTITFASGLIVKGALYTDSRSIADALSVAVGTYEEEVGFSAAEEKTIDLAIDVKKPAYSSVVSTTATAELGSSGTAQQIYVFSNENAATGIEILYDSISFDVTYPKGAVIENYGFDKTLFGKTSTNYGTVTLGDARPADSVNGIEMETRTFTISRGYKSAGNTISLFYQLSFPEDQGFDDAPYTPTAKYPFTISAPVATMGEAKITSLIRPNRHTTTYTVTEAKTDQTTLSAITSRPYVYNHSLDMDPDSYLVPLGSAVLSNPNGSDMTPYAKTYEAEFNTTRAAAKVTLITVPLGSYKTDGLTITVEGRKDGKSTRKPLTQDQIDAAANKQTAGKPDWATSTYLLIYASKLDLDEITKVTADIGMLTGGYSSSPWTSGWDFDRNQTAAYGYFTESAADRASGIQVNNTFRVYNTDPALRDRNKGDLMVTSTTTSTDERRVGLSVAQSPKLYSGKTYINELKKTPAVHAGDTAIIKGAVSPYYVAGAAYIANTSTDVVRADTTLLQDPVIYLSLPLGLTPDTSQFRFWIKTIDPQTSENKSSGDLDFTWTALGRRTVGGEEIELYRITLPKGTRVGYYDAEGKYSQLFYELAFQTDKSLPTKTYRLNDLVTFTVDGGVLAMPYACSIAEGDPLNSGTLVYVKDDIYGVNGGMRVLSITNDTDTSGIHGFGIQQLNDITVDSAISVSKINDVAVAEQWNSYSSSNPNSVALLGQKSEGQVRLRITSTDSSSKNFALVLPIPQAGMDLGALFMDVTQGYTMSVTLPEDPGPFTIQYIKLDEGPYAASDNFFGADGMSRPYTAASAETADALLITADSLASNTYELKFPFTINGGVANALNIWRPAYVYTVSGQLRQRVGSYVASAIAPHSIDGTVFEDRDRNGVQNDGEPGVGGVAVLAQDKQGRTETVTTDADGRYQFIAVRETTVQLTFSVGQDSGLRFNIDPPGGGASGVVSTVAPVSGGLSATATVEAGGGAAAVNGELRASGATTVNAAMGAFCTLTYAGNTSTAGSPPPTQEQTPGGSVTVSAKPDALQKKGYRFVEWNTQAKGKGTSYAPGSTLILTESTTLYAIWEIASYTLTFNYRGATGGVTETTRTIAHNALYGTLPTPSKTGYAFDGWSTSATATTPNVNTTASNSKFTLGADTTLYAVWSAKTGYKVTYDLNYTTGTAIPDKTGVKWTDSRLLPAAPTRTGYTFDGWKCGLTEVTSKTTYGSLAVTDAPTTEVTLTAQWTAKGGYTVNYDLNYETENRISESTGVNWTDTSLLPAGNAAPERAGYVLTGWTLSATSEGNPTYVTAAQSYGELAADEDPKHPVTLYAQWTEIGTSCVVSYDTQEGTPVASKVLADNSASGLVPDPAPTRPGYTLDGWYTAQSNGTLVTDKMTFAQAAGNDTAKTLTLFAHWTANTYTVNYSLGYSGGTAPVPQTGVTWAGTISLPKDPTRIGYTFLGWYTEAAGGTKVEPGTPYSAIAETDEANTSVTLYALWREQTYTVTYDTAGGSTLNPKTGVPYSSTAYQPDVTPTKLGYELTGWKYGETLVNGQTLGALIDASALIDNTVTLTAQWTERTGFTVKYNTGGGSTLDDNTGVKWTQTKLVPEKKDEPTRPGYTFAGWTSDRVGTVDGSTAYSALAATDAPKSYVTLVAKWTARTDYTVRYVSNCGMAIASKENCIGWTQAALLPSVSLQKNGYSFVCWQVQGQTGETAVAASDTYAALAARIGGDADNTSSITLEAVWTVRTGYSVEYDLNGGQSDVKAPTGLAYTADHLIPEQGPTRPGWRFLGWTCGGKEVTLSTHYADLAPDDTVKTLTLTANWEKKSYTVSYNTSGGSPLPDRTVYWDDLVWPTAETSKLGHQLTGWVRADDPQVVVPDTTTLSDLIPQDNALDLALTARWEERSYTVHYDTGGGTPVQDRENVQYNSSAMPLTTPEREHYVLLGWTCRGQTVPSDAACAQLLGDSANTVTELTLTAVWGGNYTITYDTGGGSLIDPKTGVQWADPGLLPDTVPQKPGFVFRHWTCRGQRVENGMRFCDLAGEGSETIAGLTFTAVWTRVYTVSYDTQGGGEIPDKTVQWTDPSLLPAVPYKPGFVFSHWTCRGQRVENDMRFCDLAGEGSEAIAGLTLTAVYTEAPPQVGEVGGVVVDGNSQDLPLPGVSVSLHLGGTDGERKAGPVLTDKNGAFTFEGIPYGIYTLVATHTLPDGTEQVITKSLIVDAPKMHAGITMPGGQRNTVVLVKENAPGVSSQPAADGLDALLDKQVSDPVQGVTAGDQAAVDMGGTLTLVLTIEPKDAEDETIQEDLTKILEQASGGSGANATVIPYDLSMLKALSRPAADEPSPTILESVPDLVDIYIPLEEAEGKTIQVLRVHGGVVHTLPYTDPAAQITETADYADGILHLRVRMFSTYAVVLETPTGGNSQGSGSHSGGSHSGGTTQNGGDPSDGTDGLTAPAAADPNATGVAAWLETSAHIAYLHGYDTGRFGPDDSMTRAQAAQMFYNLLKNKDAAAAAGFSDVPDGAWYAPAVNALAALGVMTGVGENRFAPDRAITRAEFTAAAMRFATLDAGGENPFSDVQEQDWFYASVKGAVQYGWIGGYPDGTFRPNATITRAEVAVIVNRMLARSADEAYAAAHEDRLTRFPDVDASHWAYASILEASNAHSYTRSDGKELWSAV